MDLSTWNYIALIGQYTFLEYYILKTNLLCAFAWEVEGVSARWGTTAATATVASDIYVIIQK